MVRSASMPPRGVAELRVGQRARRLVEVVRGDALERRKRAFAHDLELRERAHVDERDALAHGAMLLGDGAEPVRPALEGGAVGGVHAVGREPVRPLPAVARAEHGAPGREKAVQRRAPAAARRARLLDRPVHARSSGHRPRPSARRGSGARRGAARSGARRRPRGRAPARRARSTAPWRCRRRRSPRSPR